MFLFPQLFAKKIFPEQFVLVFPFTSNSFFTKQFGGPFEVKAKNFKQHYADIKFQGSARVRKLRKGQSFR